MPRCICVPPVCGRWRWSTRDATPEIGTQIEYDFGAKEKGDVMTVCNHSEAQNCTLKGIRGNRRTTDKRSPCRLKLSKQIHF